MEFTILCKDAENLLEDICRAKSSVKMLQKRLKDAENISLTKEWELRGLIAELKKAGYLNAYWAENTIHYCEPKMSIETYRKRLKEYIEYKAKFNASNVTNNDYIAYSNLNIASRMGNIILVGSNNSQAIPPKRDKPNVLFSSIINCMNWFKGLILKN